MFDYEIYIKFYATINIFLKNEINKIKKIYLNKTLNILQILNEKKITNNYFQSKLGELIYEYKITHRMLYRFRTKQSHETKKGNEEYAFIPCPVNFDKIKNVEYSNDSKPPYWIKRKFLEDYGITLISGKLDQGIMLVKLP